MTAGALIRLWCHRTLGRFFTFELGVKSDHALVTSGPYAIVRHPSYTGSVLISAGTILYTFAPGSYFAECVGWESGWSWALAAAWTAWWVALPVMLMSRVWMEDELMRKEFGPVWEEYRERTPWRLISYVF
jgi:protein-S-isoprenylcysteine O-methyltransferase Ste14